MKFVPLFLLILNSLLFSQSNDSLLQKKIDSLLSDIYFKSTICAVDVFDFSENKPLYSKNNTFLLLPASNMKVITSLAGLTYLGKDYTFKTRLYTEGTISSGSLMGDLYFYGSGDPDFTYNDFDSFVLALKNNGIERIKGNLFADTSNADSLFWGMGWMWDDNPSFDAPFLSSLNIDDNSIVIKVMPSDTGTSPFVSVVNNCGDIEIINKAVTKGDEKTILSIAREYRNKKNIYTLNGSLSKNDTSSYRVNYYEPHKRFLNLFVKKLQESGISFSGAISTSYLPSKPKLIYEYQRTLADVLHIQNKISKNLGAEMVIAALARKKSTINIKYSTGLKYIDSLLIKIGLDPSKYFFADGSGVSRYTMVSAELLLKLLIYAKNEESFFDSFFNSLPIGGVDGTLGGRFKGTPAEGKIFAKTGTLSGVSTLSGYAKTKSGRMLAFSILVENYVGKSSIARGYIDKICQLLVEY